MIIFNPVIAWIASAHDQNIRCWQKYQEEISTTKYIYRGIEGVSTLLFLIPAYLANDLEVRIAFVILTFAACLSDCVMPYSYATTAFDILTQIVLFCIGCALFGMLQMLGGAAVVAMGFALKRYATTSDDSYMKLELCHSLWHVYLCVVLSAWVKRIWNIVKDMMNPKKTNESMVFWISNADKTFDLWEPCKNHKYVESSWIFELFNDRNFWTHRIFYGCRIFHMWHTI